MTQQKGSKRNEHLRELAKELLTGEEYDQLKRILATFSKTGSVYQLCLELVKIVNSPEKIDLLAEVRTRIPKGLRNKFTFHCKEQFVTNTHDDHGLGEYYRRDEKENRIGKCIKPSSSVKRKKGNDVKRPALQEKNVLSRDKMKSVIDHEEEIINGLKSSETPPLDGDTAPLLVLREPREIEKGHRVFLLERDSPGLGFGFRIRGGTLKHPQITVAAVEKGSSADTHGLKVGDQLIRVNSVDCIEGDVDRDEIVRTIKATSKLYVRVATSESISEINRRRSGKREEGEGTVTVNVQPGQDGWLGCCIRGGTDYACDIHVISVDSTSPAEKAGLRKGDVLVKINGTSTANLTHIQAVRLVITSGPNIALSVKPAGRHGRSYRQPLDEQPSTPLRTGYKEPGYEHDFPLGNSFSAKFHLPGYQHPPLTSSPLCYHGLESSFESQQDEIKSNLSPPPPYTVDLPLEHKVLEKGIEKQGVGDGLHRKTICTSKEGEYEDCKGGECAVKMLCKKYQGSVDEQIGSIVLQRSQGNSSEDKIVVEGENETVAVKGTQEIHAGPRRDIAGNQDVILDGNAKIDQKEVGIAPVGDMTISGGQELQDDSGKEFFSDVIGDGLFTSTGNGCCLKGTAVNDSAVASWDMRTGVGDHVGRLQLCAFKNQGQSTVTELLNSQRRKDDHVLIANDDSLPSSQRIGRGLLLSQIQQFNKTTLKTFSEGSPHQTGRYAVKGKGKDNVCCDNLQQGQATKEKKSSSDDIVSVQEHHEAEEMFMALAKALEMRARVLNITLSDDNSQDSDEGDWDL